jgi:hypothetical protein
VLVSATKYKTYDKKQHYLKKTVIFLILIVNLNLQDEIILFVTFLCHFF